MTQVFTKYAGVAIGDIVNLKSGSPDLTVTGFSTADAVGPVDPATPGATFAEASLAVHVYGFTTAGAPVAHKLPIEALVDKAAPAAKD